MGINDEEAKIVIEEIRRIPKYRRIIRDYDEKIESINVKIEEATAPKSPNGIESIGEGRTSTFEGKGSLLNSLLSDAQDLEERRRYTQARLHKAEVYRNRVFRENYGFCADYFNGQLSYRQIEKKHSVSNARDRMIRICKNSIRSVDFLP